MIANSFGSPEVGFFFSCLNCFLWQREILVLSNAHKFELLIVELHRIIKTNENSGASA